MKQIISVTIGIPAYNEEGNIRQIIQDILCLDESRVQIKKIIINSDGSTDNTNEYVKEINAKRLKLIANSKREGKAKRTNEIFNMSDTDWTIILDADIRLKDKNFLNDMSPLMNQNVHDLISCRIVETDRKSFLNKVLKLSMAYKREMFEKWKNGNNPYTCKGSVLAYSKRLYKLIRVKNVTGEDLYVYLYSVTNGFKYAYLNTTVAYYELPHNLADHQKQSIRYVQSYKNLHQIFGKKISNEYLRIPISIQINQALKFMHEHPIEFICYLFILVSCRFKSLFSDYTNGIWKMSTSTKNVNSPKAK